MLYENNGTNFSCIQFYSYKHAVVDDCFSGKYCNSQYSCMSILVHISEDFTEF